MSKFKVFHGEGDGIEALKTGHLRVVEGGATLKPSSRVFVDRSRFMCNLDIMDHTGSMSLHAVVIVDEAKVYQIISMLYPTFEGDMQHDAYARVISNDQHSGPIRDITVKLTPEGVEVENLTERGFEWVDADTGTELLEGHALYSQALSLSRS